MVATANPVGKVHAALQVKTAKTEKMERMDLTVIKERRVLKVPKEAVTTARHREQLLAIKLIFESGRKFELLAGFKLTITRRSYQCFPLHLILMITFVGCVKQYTNYANILKRLYE